MRARLGDVDLKPIVGAARDLSQSRFAAEAPSVFLTSREVRCLSTWPLFFKAFFLGGGARGVFRWPSKASV